MFLCISANEGIAEELAKVEWTKIEIVLNQATDSLKSGSQMAGIKAVQELKTALYDKIDSKLSPESKVKLTILKDALTSWEDLTPDHSLVEKMGPDATTTLANALHDIRIVVVKEITGSVSKEQSWESLRDIGKQLLTTAELKVATIINGGGVANMTCEHREDCEAIEHFEEAMTFAIKLGRSIWKAVKAIKVVKQYLGPFIGF